MHLFLVVFLYVQLASWLFTAVVFSEVTLRTDCVWWEAGVEAVGEDRRASNTVDREIQKRCSAARPQYLLWNVGSQTLCNYPWTCLLWLLIG